MSLGTGIVYRTRMRTGDAIYELAEWISGIEGDGHAVTGVRAENVTGSGAVGTELSVEVPVASVFDPGDADVDVRGAEAVDEETLELTVDVRLQDGNDFPADGEEGSPADSESGSPGQGEVDGSSGTDDAPGDGSTGEEPDESDEPGGPDEQTGSEELDGHDEPEGSGESHDTGDDATSPDGTHEADPPAYRDPGKLREAYENNDTFAAMTDALDVDVTSQTVRKYAIEHGIHEVSTRSDPDVGDEPVEDTDEADDPDTRHPGTDDGTTDDANVDDAEGPDRETVTDGSGRGGTAGPVSPDGRGDEPAVDPGSTGSNGPDVRARVDSVASEVLPDGESLPGELDAAGFVDAVREAGTLYDLQRLLDLDRDRTRALLDRLDLLDLVHGRVSRIDEDPSPGKVRERIAAAADDHRPGDSDAPGPTDDD